MSSVETPPRILIVEPSAAGHYMTSYVRLLVREGRARGWRMALMTTPEATRDRAFEPVRAEGGGALEIVTVEGDTSPPATTGALIRAQLRWRRAFARAFQASGGSELWDVAYVNNLDRVDKAIAMLGSPFGRTPFAGMMISQRFHHSAMEVRSPRTRSDALYARLFDRMLREPSMRALVTIDEPLAAFAARHPGAHYRKVRYAPDPATLRKEAASGARGRIGLKENAVVVLLYGSIELRKGVAEVLEVMRRKDVPPEVVLVLAGRHDDDATRLLADPSNRALIESGRVLLLPGFHDDDAEADLFAAADIVWLGYVGFYGPSGVLLQSGQAGLPVIAARDGIVGWTVERERLGVVVDPRDSSAVAGAIADLIHSPAARREYGERGRTYARPRTAEVFATALANAIEGRANRVSGR